MPAAIGGHAATTSNVTVSGTVATLLAANTARVGFVLWNESGQTVFVKFGSGATTSSYTRQIANGGVYEARDLYRGQVTAITSTGSGAVRVTEITA